jgi:hypothetical protein
MRSSPGSPSLIVVLASVIACVAVAAVSGAADSLALASDQVGAASSAVPKCSTVGMAAVENVSGSSIVSVTVSQIDAACAGGTLSLTVNNGTINGSGLAAVPGGGGSITITLGSAVPFASNAGVDLLVAGP